MVLGLKAVRCEGSAFHLTVRCFKFRVWGILLCKGLRIACMSMFKQGFEVSGILGLAWNHHLL